MKIRTLCTMAFGGAGTGSLRRVKAIREYTDIDNTMVALSGPNIQSVNYLKYLIARSKFKQYWDEFAKRSIRPLTSLPGFNSHEAFSKAVPVDESIWIDSVRDADIIHLHWVNGLINYENSFLSRFKGPIVWTLADMNAFTGGCHYSQGCEEYKNNCGSCPLLGGDKKIASDTWNKKNKFIKSLRNLTIICPSEWLANKARRSSILKDVPVVVINNPNDTSFYPYVKVASKLKKDIPPTQICALVGAGSTGNKRKGIDILLDAISILEEDEELLEGMTLLKYGRGEIQSKFNTIDVGFFEDINKQIDIFSTSDFNIFTSREENSPLVVQESLQIGTPVISFNCGNVPDLITNKYCGLVINDIDAQSLADGIKKYYKFCKQSSPYTRMLHCVKRVNEFNNTERSALMHRDLYLHVLDKFGNIEDICNDSISTKYNYSSYNTNEISLHANNAGIHNISKPPRYYRNRYYENKILEKMTDIKIWELDDHCIDILCSAFQKNPLTLKTSELFERFIHEHISSLGGKTIKYIYFPISHLPSIAIFLSKRSPDFNCKFIIYHIANDNNINKNIFSNLDALEKTGIPDISAEKLFSTLHNKNRAFFVLPDNNEIHNIDNFLEILKRINKNDQIVWLGFNRALPVQRKLLEWVSDETLVTAFNDKYLVLKKCKHDPDLKFLIRIGLIIPLYNNHDRLMLLIKSVQDSIIHYNNINITINMSLADASEDHKLINYCLNQIKCEWISPYVVFCPDTSFWAESIYRGFLNAANQFNDFNIIANADVTLSHNALTEMINELHKVSDKKAIVTSSVKSVHNGNPITVGALFDPDTENVFHPVASNVFSQHEELDLFVLSCCFGYFTGFTVPGLLKEDKYLPNFKTLPHYWSDTEWTLRLNKKEDFSIYLSRDIRVKVDDSKESTGTHGLNENIMKRLTSPNSNDNLFYLYNALSELKEYFPEEHQFLKFMKSMYNRKLALIPK